LALVEPKLRPTGGHPVAAPSDEGAVVARIERAVLERFGAVPEGEIWIGDDAAVVAGTGGPLVLATDAAVAGVHADLELVSLGDLGWKAMAATISDIGAMGGRPLYALVTLCVPAGVDVDQLVAGVVDAGRAWDCAVVGGDLSGADQVMVSVAVTGTLDDGSLPPVTRGGASPGDHLFVTGELGASAAGLRLLRIRRTLGTDRPTGPSEYGAMDTESDAALVVAHRRPRARVSEGRAARAAGATAMIDVSDGLSLDLHRLAVASGVGVELVDVPVARGATEEEALGGGEDFELVIATGSPQRLIGQFERVGLRPPLRIGRCTSDRAQRTLRGGPLVLAGWQHDLR
jgi:thiamine-monophosphate kinase